MTNAVRSTFLGPLFIFLVVCSWPRFGQAQSTESGFSYQGQLSEGGESADGVYDFQFVLYDSPDFATGTVFAGPQTIVDVEVRDGVFAVEVDFGANVFGGLTLWLEIRVRPGSSTSAFTTLSPREKVTPVPLALYAVNVEPGAINSVQLAQGAVGSLQVLDNSIAASDVNRSQIQLRIGNSCQPGSAIRSVAGDGTVVCQDDADTTYSAGTGLTLDAFVFNLDPASAQTRIIGSCPQGTFMAGVNQDGSVACNGFSIPLKRTLDTRAQDVSAALGASGFPIISFWSVLTGSLRFYECANASCSRGFGRTLDSGMVGRDTGIAVRPNGFPIISYYDYDNGALKVFDCLNPQCSTGIDRTLDLRTGQDTSIAIRQSGNPIISYWEAATDELVVFDCADSGCTSGSANPVAGGLTQRPFARIAIGVDGNPIISYRNAVGESVNVFACASDNCSEGSQIPLAEASASQTDIAIRQNGLPIVSFSSGGSSLMLFDCSRTDCSLGTERTGDPDSAGVPSISVRDDGRPIVMYARSGAELWVLDCTEEDCSSAIRRRLDGVTASYPSMLIRPDGMPFVAFGDPDNGGGNLSSYSCGDENCEN